MRVGNRLQPVSFIILQELFVAAFIIIVMIKLRLLIQYMRIFLYEERDKSGLRKEPCVVIILDELPACLALLITSTDFIQSQIGPFYAVGDLKKRLLGYSEQHQGTGNKQREYLVEDRSVKINRYR